MKPPCFDEKTKTDCPRRKPGCGATCEKWQEYMVEREKVYEARKNLCEIGASIKESYFTNRDAYLRRKTRERHRRFRRRG